MTETVAIVELATAAKSSREGSNSLVRVSMLPLRELEFRDAHALCIRRSSPCPIDCLSFSFKWEKSSWRLHRIRIVIMNESGFATTFGLFETGLGL